MSDIYDVLENQENTAAGENKEAIRYSPEEYRELKQAEKQAVYDMIDQGLLEIRDNEDVFQKYLDTQSRLDRYTVNNTILIMKQRKDASQLKSADDWRVQGASIKKREKHIKILKPYSYQTPDGHMGTGYNVKKVFDISQTTARPVVRLSKISNERMLLRALIDSPPVRMEVIDDPGDRGDAFFDREAQRLYISRGLESGDFFRAVSKELSHAQLAADLASYDRESMEPHADCASYMLCKKYGVQPAEGAPVLPKEWRQMEPKELRLELSMAGNAMQKINGKMAAALDRMRSEKKKEEPGR